MAGVVAYWSEGAKRCNYVQFSNSDERLVRVFLQWAQRYLGVSPDRFVARLHLHTGQDEDEALERWSRATGLRREQFGKTFSKPEGTGHRKNRLYQGTLSVRVRRSTDMLERIIGWTNAVASVSLGR